MKKKLFGLTLLSMATFFAMPALAAEYPNVITSSATENMEVEPDMVTFSAAVITEDKKPEKAIEENNRKAKLVQDSVKTMLESNDKIKTSGYTVNPVYTYNKSAQKNEITGYRVQNSVQIETRKVEKVGKLIQTALNSGANNVNNLVFSVKDDEKYRSQLLEKAAVNAREKADIVANALGVKIIGVKSVNFGGNRIIATPLYSARKFSMEAADGAAPQEVPVSAGEIDINANVTVEFLIQN